MKRNVYPVCPCSSDNVKTTTVASYAQCCGRFLEGTDLPETAEQLMRSRYTAFVLENEAYLLDSWHPDQRPAKIDFDTHIKWLGLKIKQTRSGGADDQEGWVEFVARFKISGKAERIEELSYFIKVANRWQYVSAVDEITAS